MKFKVEFDSKETVKNIRGRFARAKENIATMTDTYKEERKSHVSRKDEDNLDYLENLIDWNIERVRAGGEIYIPARLDKKSEDIVRLMVSRETR